MPDGEAVSQATGGLRVTGGWNDPTVLTTDPSFARQRGPRFREVRAALEAARRLQREVMTPAVILAELLARAGEYLGVTRVEGPGDAHGPAAIVRGDEAQTARS